ncbi:MAG: histidine kinase [Limisphaerales bacterium]
MVNCFQRSNRPGFNSFLKQIFASPAKQSANFDLLCPGELSKSVNIEAQRLLNGKECRAVMIDHHESQTGPRAAQRRLDVITASNQKTGTGDRPAPGGGDRPQTKRAAPKSGCWRSRDTCRNSLRQLSRQVLHAQEEERKRISRELHDVIAQTLTGINLRLATLKKEAAVKHDRA